MKNIQIVDGATNATFSIFQASDADFGVIFPDGQDMELVEDLFERVGEPRAVQVLTELWGRPVLKREALGIHGTLFYDNEARRSHMPESKREVDWAASAINEAQRELFNKSR